jgi:hypothetical protein
MCGPSTQEKNLAGQSASLSSQLAAEASQNFASQSGILASLNKSLSPIVAAGPNQQGFSAPELASLNTSAINNAGAASRNATQAAQGALAGRGGDSGLQSGVDAQILGTIKSNSANQLAGAQDQIQQANYATGRQNFFNGVSGQQGLAGLYNPNAYAETATGANASAFKQADTISNEQNAEAATIAGGIAGVAGAGLGIANGSDAISSLGGGKLFGSGGIFG